VGPAASTVRAHLVGPSMLRPSPPSCTPLAAIEQAATQGTADPPARENGAKPPCRPSSRAHPPITCALGAHLPLLAGAAALGLRFVDREDVTRTDRSPPCSQRKPAHPRNTHDPPRHRPAM